MEVEPTQWSVYSKFCFRFLGFLGLPQRWSSSILGYLIGRLYVIVVTKHLNFRTNATIGWRLSTVIVNPDRERTILEGDMKESDECGRLFRTQQKNRSCNVKVMTSLRFLSASSPTYLLFFVQSVDTIHSR
jgi:hypothetical protein